MFFLAELFTINEKKEFVGYAILSLISEHKSAYLYRIGVAPDYRNYGIGKEIMRNILNFIQTKEYKLLLLHVEKGNISARRLYDRFNFYIISSDKDILYMGRDVNGEKDG